MNKEIIEKIKQYAEEKLSESHDPSHDMKHVMRVYNLACKIAKEEQGDVDIDVIQAATLLHDIGGSKELSDPTGQTDHAIESAKMSKPFLESLGLAEDKIKHIQDCIISHRYKTENEPQTIEAKILFDADKLDATGAIGITRICLWIAKQNANIYRDISVEDYIKENMGGKTRGRIQDKTKHSINLEYEVKTKHLIDKLYTDKAREICKDRMKFFKEYLDRLEREIKGEI